MGGSVCTISFTHIPLLLTGFTSALRAATGGQAFPQCVFDHWQVIKGLPLEDAKAQETVVNIRKRKGLKEEIPQADYYMDKM